MSESLDFMEMFGNITGTSNTPYYCNKCHALLEKIVVKTMQEIPRKLFYCQNNKCERYGLLTVVAKKS